jgi:hypothetical protein
VEVAVGDGPGNALGDQHDAFAIELGAAVGGERARAQEESREEADGPILDRVGPVGRADILWVWPRHA